MSDNDLISVLKGNTLTSFLSDEELKDLIPFIKEQVYQKGDLVVKEGEDTRVVYLVKSGDLEVGKMITDISEIQQLSLLSSGDFFGEMAHLENKARFANVWALEESVVLALDLDLLQKDKEKEGLYSKIVARLAKNVSKYLRETSESLIHSLKEKLQIMKTHAYISNVLVHIIILVAVWFNLYELVELFPYYEQEFGLFAFTFTFALFFLSTTYLIVASKRPLKFFGITTERWLRCTVEAIAYSLPVMLMLLLTKWYLVTHVEAFHSLPLFPGVEHYKSILGYSLIYIVFSAIQEFIARGGLQSCFVDFFYGKYSTFKAVVFANLIFQILHTVKNFWVAMLSLVLGFFWGYLFHKQKSIVGVAVSHASIGVWGFYILDFENIIRLIQEM